MGLFLPFAALEPLLMEEELPGVPTEALGLLDCPKDEDVEEVDDEKAAPPPATDTDGDVEDPAEEDPMIAL